jgi:hypothetical protein
LRKAKPSHCSIKQAVFRSKVQNYLARDLIAEKIMASKINQSV